MGFWGRMKLHADYASDVLVFGIHPVISVQFSDLSN